MPKKTAGLLLFRDTSGDLEVLLVHPGGPFWAKKDDGAWTIPKGEYGEGEDPASAARREFQEETGLVPEGELIPLTEIRQAGGKVVRAWAMEGDCDAATLHSNTFTMEWPPRSGRMASFPEVDRCAWFDPALARERINPAQVELIDRLELALTGPPPAA